MLCFYACKGRDPETVGEPETAHFGGELVNIGINTTRGAAAEALANVLFGNKTRWKKIRKGIQCVVSDRSWAVRAVAISTLTALLNVDRSLAVKWFLEAVQEAPSLLGSLFVSRFLYYAIFSHYEALRKLLLKMLEDPDAAARESAAQTICIASLSGHATNDDLEIVKRGDETCMTDVQHS